MDKRFVFVAGVEGSGTTVLSRLLSAPEQCASLGGLHVKIPESDAAEKLVAAFDEANMRASDRAAPLIEHQEALAAWREAMADIVDSPEFASISQFVFKRSFPFGPRRSDADPFPRFVPNLWECLDVWPGTKIVVIYRDPAEATYSCLDRRFDSDLGRLANTCAEQLTSLAAQVRAIGVAKCRVVSYRELCENPTSTLTHVARFCQLPAEPLMAAAKTEGLPKIREARYVAALGASRAAWLDEFFRVRSKQWDNLSSAVSLDVLMD